jgi:outer membrane protein insertion porin family
VRALAATMIAVAMSAAVVARAQDAGAPEEAPDSGDPHTTIEPSDGAGSEREEIGATREAVEHGATGEAVERGATGETGPGAAGASGGAPRERDEGDGDDGVDGAPGPAEDDGAATASDSAARYALERTVIRGNRRTATYVILRALPFRDGEPLDVDDARLEQARYQLLGTGFFDSVRLSIERGRARGRVVLVVEVRERNTFMLQEIGLGFAFGPREQVVGATQDDFPFYVGATVAETNFLGTGAILESSVALSGLQQGVRLRFSEPRAFGSPLALTLSGFFLNAREAYGNDVLVTPIATPIPDPGSPFGPDEATAAIVRYHRGGGALGTGLLLAPTTRFSATYQLEIVDVLARPDAASEGRGTEVVPIDFALHDRTSLVTTLTLGVTHDDRDAPGLTTRGRVIGVRADLGNRLLGGDYDFFRAQASWREWIPLPSWQHTLRLGVFVGAALGDVPVFYHFYASDLSDLVPSRMLELNLDRRSSPNLLGTAIAELRFADLGSRVDLEYAFRIADVAGELRAIWGFVNVGVFALADTEHLVRPIPGYAVSIPIDLTFDVGVRLDTSVGLFQIGFSTLVGFVPFQ